MRRVWSRSGGWRKVDEEPTAYTGTLPDGGTYLLEVPRSWEGGLLLHCPGFAPEEGALPRLVPHPGIRSWLLDHGYALASASYSSPGFWALEAAFSDLASVLDIFEREVGHPERSFAWGNSIGGIITAGLVQLIPERLTAAMPLCGSLAGGVATRNENLDCTFVLKSLLAPDSPLDLVRIADPEKNLALGLSILARAQRTGEGKARIALAAAVGGIPGWFDPASGRPADDDVLRIEANQFRWLQEVDLPIFFGARAVLEKRAGGNPSWNTGVDYARQLSASPWRHVVSALYAAAGLDLDADLTRLAGTERIAADPPALEYLERHITFTGDLAETPVLTLHTVADGLVVVESEQAYADVVSWAGQDHLLRQLFLDRPGHCAFTAGELLGALEALTARVETGAWTALDAATLNARCAELPGGSQFCAFEPACFLRPHDVRNTKPRLSPESHPGEDQP
ncbi:MAG: hypothetical protein ACYC1D_03150 [Acidimicrobiales bacterium]